MRVGFDGGVVQLAPANADVCWYCFGPVGDDLVFSWEFDTCVHLHCIRDRVTNSPDDLEAAILAQEFGVIAATAAARQEGGDA